MCVTALTTCANIRCKHILSSQVKLQCLNWWPWMTLWVEWSLQNKTVVPRGKLAQPQKMQYRQHLLPGYPEDSTLQYFQEHYIHTHNTLFNLPPAPTHQKWEDFLCFIFVGICGSLTLSWRMHHKWFLCELFVNKTTSQLRFSATQKLVYESLRHLKELFCTKSILSLD